MIAGLRPPPASLCQTIPSRLEAADSLSLEVSVFLKAAGLSELCFPVELLARECLVNAVVHGNRSAADKSVDLRLFIGSKWIRLQVTDEGQGFAWRKAGQKRLDTNRSSGRGLRLCAMYADRVRFNRKGNRIALWISKTKRTGKEVLENGCLCSQAKGTARPGKAQG